MEQAHLFAIGVLLAWLAGIRVYLTVFGVGLAGFFGWLDLPQAMRETCVALRRAGADLVITYFARDLATALAAEAHAATTGVAR